MLTRYAFLSLTFVLIIIDAIVSETGDDDAMAAFGLSAVRYGRVLRYFLGCRSRKFFFT
jgi:hypothetical protein